MLNPILIDALRVAVISGFCSLAGWVALYSFLAPWWRNPIGRTLVIKSMLIAMLLIPTMISLFFHMTQFESVVVGWADFVLIALITPVMIWRSAVWQRIYRKGKSGEPGGDV